MSNNGRLIIYLPNTFAYVMYGNFLDRFPGMTGFRIVFSVTDRLGSCRCRCSLRS